MNPIPDARWFAVQVRPRAEKAIARMLQLKGYEEFTPLYRTKRHWSDRTRDLQLPLFPGYVFVRLSASNARIVTTPGVVRIVGYGKHPSPVEDREITTIQQLAASDLPVIPHPFLQAGARVRIVVGPLAGAEGVVIREKADLRLILSVTLLQRSVAVEIDSSWIETNG